MMSAMICLEFDLADGVVPHDEPFCHVLRNFSPFLLGFFRQCRAWHGDSASRPP